MKMNKDTVEQHKEEAAVVFDDSMKGKTIDAIADPKLSLNFRDDGKKFVPIGKQNLMCPGQRIASDTYMKRYSDMAWECEECGEMHRKGDTCNGEKQRRNK